MGVSFSVNGCFVCKKGAVDRIASYDALFRFIFYGSDAGNRQRLEFGGDLDSMTN